MNFMNRFFSRYLSPMDDGDGGGASGGTSAGTQSTDAPSQNSESTAGAPASGTGLEGATGNESGGSGGEPASGGNASGSPVEKKDPTSMLDAIEKGLEEIKGASKPGEEPSKETPKQEESKAAEADDPLKQPDGLHPKAATRFQQLVTMVKERDQQLEQLKTSTQGAMAAASTMGRFIKETGASMEQFSDIGAYLKARNSGDVRTEANIVIGLMQDLQMRTGIKLDDILPALDPLSKFPDLNEAVGAYQITREHAMEIAKAREQQSLQTQQQTIQSAHQAEAQGWIAAKDEAVSGIKAWEQEMARTDPDYAEISALMKSNGEGMEWVVKNTPPQQWKHHMTLLYNQTKAARQKFAASNGGQPRPLGNTGGKPQGAGQAPKNMFQAMFPNG